MKFALVKSIKAEAKKGVKGFCPICNAELIAKCGENREYHWSHKRIQNCDEWWEKETEWHRSWKNNYPREWQEFVFKDPHSSEKHIADVLTKHDLVIEFQHSNIDPKERASREKFYKNMVWVVDGTRLKKDYIRFSKSVGLLIETEKKGIFLVDQFAEIFPINWVGSSVPVIFDFKGLKDLSDLTDQRHNLYCLFQIKIGRYFLLAKISRDIFIRTTINGEWLTRSQNFINTFLVKQEKSIQQLNTKTTSKHNDGTHYYDSKRGHFVKKRRL